MTLTAALLCVWLLIAAYVANWLPPAPHNQPPTRSYPRSMQ